MYITLLIFGILLIIYSLVQNTKNFKSALFYKVFPMFAGLYNIFMYLVLTGIFVI